MSRRLRAVGPRRTFQLRVTEPELLQLQAAAEAADRSASDWARGILLAQARRVLAGLDVDLDARPARLPEEVLEAKMDAALAVQPRLSDREIAEQLDVTISVVEKHRRARGIPGVGRGERSRTGWQSRVRELVEQGHTVGEIAEELGYTVGTTRTKLSQLGLRAPTS